MSSGQELGWDDLRIFLHVARTGSLSRAARKLQVDHSTISRRIAQLEYAIGASLFERNRAGLKLTERGNALLEHVLAMERHLLKITESIAVENNAPGGTVRLAAMEGISSLYLARRLHRLQDAHPEITLELVTSAQLVNVSRREADLFLSFFQPQGRGLDSRKLGEIALCLYASQRYLDTFGTPRNAADLVHHRFVTYVEDLIQLDAVRWLDDVIKERRVTFHSTSMISQMGAATAGLGIVLLPVFSVENEPSLRPILWPEICVQRELWLSVHSDLQFLPRVKSVAKFLANLFESDREYLSAPRL